MDETKYLVLADYFGAFVRGDIVMAADLAAPVDAVLTDGSIRVATPEEAALGRVPLEQIADARQTDENARVRFGNLQSRIDEARAANPQRGAIPPAEAPRALAPAGTPAAPATPKRQPAAKAAPVEEASHAE